jgi:hypothetical protein
MLQVGGSAIRIPALKHRWIVIALALAAATAFAVSAEGGRWWTIGDVDVGPFGSHSPFAGAGGLDWAGGGVRWVRFGAASGAAALIAMFVLIIMAGRLAARKLPKLAAKTALVAIATSLAAAIGFTATRPDGLEFAIGSGIAWLAAAIVVGLAAAIAVVRMPH